MFAFLYNIGYLSPITLLFSFFYQAVNSKVTVLDKIKKKQGQRQTAFILSVNRLCLRWLSCLSPSSVLSVSPHYFTIYLSGSLDSAVWSEACLCFPCSLRQSHFCLPGWNFWLFLCLLVRASRQRAELSLLGEQVCAANDLQSLSLAVISHRQSSFRQFE